MFSRPLAIKLKGLAAPGEALENIGDVKQDGKRVPDLLESIMKAPGLVKEEVRHVFSKSVNLDTKSQESRFDPKV